MEFSVGEIARGGQDVVGAGSVSRRPETLCVLGSVCAGASSVGPSLSTHWYRPGAPWDEALAARSLEALSAGEALSMEF